MFVGDFKPGKPGVIPQPFVRLEAVGDPQELAGRKRCSVRRHDLRPNIHRKQSVGRWVWLEHRVRVGEVFARQ